MLLSVVVMGGCSNPPPAPTTPAELIAAYQSAYDRGDTQGVLALAKLEDAADAMFYAL